ncbi:hypothetical protein P167DRAFT_602120 [Morchella conica CCBAS932]|uniref:Six-hairpin glycosidase n=1 Tax=Morchella conica CCBAS932 TaxID=1392247 RepID=A0A3N4LG88_9PEZI|nr:hypothetical protein P167DRAFT_602120 [Morchella conica CCBAS932]
MFFSKSSFAALLLAMPISQVTATFGGFPTSPITTDLVSTKLRYARSMGGYPTEVKTDLHSIPHANTPRSERIMGRDAGSVISEGVRLSNDFWNYFWDSDKQHYVSKRQTSETLGDFNGTLLWGYVVGTQGLLEAQAQSGEFSDEITAALGTNGIGKFFQSSLNAYTAWVYPGTDKDAYYDDNAQVAIAFLRAYELGLPDKAMYLTQAQKVIDFLSGGWDETNGGVTWHYGNAGRNAVTTSLTAVAMLRLVKLGQVTPGMSKSQLMAFAVKCIEWVLTELQVDSGLIKDGPNDAQIYTYNTGLAIHAISLMNELNPSYNGGAKARTLVNAALDRSKGLFDTSVTNAEHRYWWDNVFFCQLLVEGLAEYVRVFGNDNKALASQIKTEFQRHTDYIMTYLKDGSDGLYWRGLELYTINEDTLAAYKTLTGDTTRQPKYAQEERYYDAASKALPIAQRGMAKTVIGQGGVARILLIAARYL